MCFFAIKSRVTLPEAVFHKLLLRMSPRHLQLDSINLIVLITKGLGQKSDFSIGSRERSQLTRERNNLNIFE